VEAEAPERALRQFLQAFLEQDRHALHRLTIDCPDRQELWSFGEPITNPQRRREFLESTMRRAALGETVYLPVPEDVQPVTLREHFINDGRAVILLDNDRSLPWLMVRSGGAWRVDPYPFVRAIKVGKEAPTTGPIESGGYGV
jgi:hypothetical protein